MFRERSAMDLITYIKETFLFGSDEVYKKNNRYLNITATSTIEIKV